MIYRRLRVKKMNEDTWPQATFWPDPPKEVPLWKIAAGAAVGVSLLMGPAVAAAILSTPSSTPALSDQFNSQSVSPSHEPTEGFAKAPQPAAANAIPDGIFGSASESALNIENARRVRICHQYKYYYTVETRCKWVNVRHAASGFNATASISPASTCMTVPGMEDLSRQACRQGGQGQGGSDLPRGGQNTQGGPNGHRVPDPRSTYPGYPVNQPPAL